MSRMAHDRGVGEWHQAHHALGVGMPGVRMVHYQHSGGLPQPGDAFQALTDAAKARQIALFRQTQAKEKALGSRGSRLTLESLQAHIGVGGMKELPIIVKADVQGSAEVLSDTLTKLTDEKVKELDASLKAKEAEILDV